MLKKDLFGWLVKLHYENLKECSQFIKDGKILDRRGNPLKEWEDECEDYKGILIVANGDKLVNRLIEDRVVHDKKISDFYNVKSSDDLASYFKSQRGCDGAYVFDSINSRITRVYELNNDLPYNNLLEMIPKDFFYYSGDPKADEHHFGTKTRLAVKLPHSYSNVETFQVKRGAYTELGMGKVTHFDNQGIIEEFFFKPEENEIVGIYRKYRDEHGNAFRGVDGYLIPYSTKIVDIKNPSSHKPAENLEMCLQNYL